VVVCTYIVEERTHIKDYENAASPRFFNPQPPTSAAKNDANMMNDE